MKLSERIMDIIDEVALLETENAELKQRETDLELIIKQLGRGAGGKIPECVLLTTPEETPISDIPASP